MPIQLTDCFREMVEGCAKVIGIPAPIIDAMVVKLVEEKGELCLISYFPQYMRGHPSSKVEVHYLYVKWDASLRLVRGMVKSIYLDMRRQLIEAMYSHWRCPVPKNLTPEDHIYTDLTDHELELIDNCLTSYMGLIFHD